MFFGKKNLVTIDINNDNVINGTFMVLGWVASNKPVGRIDIDDNGTLYDGRLVERPDVEGICGKDYKHITGFRQEIDISAPGAAQERHVRVSVYNTGGGLIGKQEGRETLRYGTEAHGDNPTLLFIHIPKTAGTTMRSIFSELYKEKDIYSIYKKTAGPTMRSVFSKLYKEKDIYSIYTKHDNANDISDFRKLSNEAKNKVRLFTGHVPYGLHKSIPQTVRYFTMLRNPVNRVISFFQAASNNKSHEYYKLIKDNKMGLADFIKRGVANQVDNRQTRMLSAMGAGFGKCTQEMLETAKRNIEENIAVVGLTERFDESLILMKREFGWGDVFYTRRNITSKALPKQEVTDELIDIVRQQNSLDVELYQFAEERLERQIAEQGASFADELQEFKRVNATGGKS